MTDETANTRQNYKDGNDWSMNSPYSDYSASHADQTLNELIRSRSGDSREQDLAVRRAQVLATLSLRDKVDELVAVVGQALGVNAELSETVKKATNVTVAELRKATVREVA